jgi:hypothetical protein
MLQWRLEFPYRLTSPNHGKLHWSTRHRQNKEIHRLIKIFFLQDQPALKLPAKVRFIRIAPRKFDDDNLAMAFKPFRDAIAKCFWPASTPGQMDGDPRLEWRYDQIKGDSFEHTIKIDVLLRLSQSAITHADNSYDSLS